MLETVVKYLIYTAWFLSRDLPVIRMPTEHQSKTISEVAGPRSSAVLGRGLFANETVEKEMPRHKGSWRRLVKLCPLGLLPKVLCGIGFIKCLGQVCITLI